MIPTIVIVGRPNVGKSTLFNRLTRSRDAIVADFPGLTRDRHYGRGRIGDRPYIVIDTGGFEPTAGGVLRAMAKQTLQAIDESDFILFMVDGRQGLTAQDRNIGEQLRKTGRQIWLVVNKAEGMQPTAVNAEFHEMGLGEPLAISAAHGEGVSDLAGLMTADLPADEGGEGAMTAESDGPRVAVIGRPNVGKSTLVNRLLGEDRMVVFDEPGTTRDSIHVEFQRGGRSYTLIDTAGVRRRGSVSEAVEKYSVVKTLQAIEDANVVILVLDARSPITEQDAHIAGYIVEAGRAMVIAVNKWDGLDAQQKDWARRSLARTLNFVDFAPVQYMSALEGTNVGLVMDGVDLAYEAAMAKLPTPKLTRALIDAVTRQQPPRAGPVRPKLRYAHQGGSNPPRIVIHGTSLSHVSADYRRYLERFFRNAFKLDGTPLKIEFRQGQNPYAKRGARR